MVNNTYSQNQRPISDKKLDNIRLHSNGSHKFIANINVTVDLFYKNI